MNRKQLKTIWKNLLDIRKDRDKPMFVKVSLYSGEHLIDYWDMILRLNHKSESECVKRRHDFNIKAEIVKD